MPTVNVAINGKNYRMACDEGEEPHLEMLAAEFDQYVNRLKGSFGEIGDQRLTVMAAIMVTDELLEIKKKMSELEQTVDHLHESNMLNSREKQAGDDELAKGIESVAKKIEKLNERLSSPSA